ncbi:MAG: ATPase [Frankiaceae bacterium]|nr:ATPase [Frankiaceae bacterium]
MDSVPSKLDELSAVLESARAMPMSASCVVNRAELLGLVAELRALLPDEISKAQDVLQDKDDVLAEGRREAARIIAEAREQQRGMLAEEEVYVQAQAEADRILLEATNSAQAMRAEVDDYVDGKLANFEIVLTKTLTSVERGRAKLAGRNELAEIVDRRDEAALPG